MPTITFVTGNEGKLRELQALAPKSLDFKAIAIDLPEIQSLDSREIVADKLRRAYEIVGGPVIVEDVSAGLDSLNGLPGPFYKFFEQKLGRDALYKLAGQENIAVTIACCAGYYGGVDMVFGEGVLRGKVVSPRGANGFGFDPVIVPEGESRTLAEMSPEEKNSLSHRHKALEALLSQLKA
jgi:inosine triphosphate pyrophosphatase